MASPTTMSSGGGKKLPPKSRLTTGGNGEDDRSKRQQNSGYRDSDFNPKKGGDYTYPKKDAPKERVDKTHSETIRRYKDQQRISQEGINRKIDMTRKVFDPRQHNENDYLGKRSMGGSSSGLFGPMPQLPSKQPYGF